MKQNWAYKKLGDIASFESGSRPKGGVGYLKDGVLSLGGEHIGRNGRIDLSNAKYVSREYYDSNNKGHLCEGDILLCKDGALTGKVAIERGELHGVLSMVNEHVFIIRTNVVSQWYLFYYLFSPIVQGLIRERITGSAQGGINGTQLKTIPVPYPKSFQEQQRIVSEFDLLQSIIDKQKVQLKELDNLAQAVFYDMFGDPVENEKGWEVKKLGEVASFKNGLNYSLNETGKKYYIIGVSDFQSKSEISCDSELSTIYTNGTIDNGYLLQDNDILFVRSNGNKQLIARNILVKTNKLDVTFSGFCIRARIINDAVSPLFVNFLLKLPSSHKVLTMKGRGCNISNLNQTTLNDFPIILPSLSLQQSFAAKIESIEKQKVAISKSIAETKKLYDYTMDKYFG